MFDPSESDAQLVARLRGALRVVDLTLAQIPAETVEMFRRDDWRLVVSRDGIHIIRRRSDSVTAAARTLSDEIAAFLSDRDD